MNERLDGFPFSEPLIRGIQACNRGLTERTSVTSHCHGSKFVGSQKSFSREKDICLFERWKKRVRATVLLLRVIMHRKAIHVNAIVSLYFSIAGPQFAETRNFDTIAM